MDSISQFDVVLDLFDTDVLYDYVECKEYRRPASGKWDLSVFHSKGTLDCVQDDDENGQFRVDLMDKAFADTKLLEKKSKKSKSEEGGEEVGDKAEKSGAYALDVASSATLPSRIIPIYKPGDTVKGTVDLELKKALPAAKLVVGLRGQAFVRIWAWNGVSSYPIDKSDIFVDEATALWQHVDDKMEDPGDDFSLTDKSASVAKGTELNAGFHSYPFQFNVPLNAGQSTPPLVMSTLNKGHIVYRIKAMIDQGKKFSRGNISTHKGLWVRRPMDIAGDPENLQPVTLEETFGTSKVAFWKSGSVSVQVNLDRTGALVGEDIPVTLGISNESKGRIESISSRIRMHGKARSGLRRLILSSNIDIKSVKVTEGPLEAGESKEYRLMLPWDFSESSADGNLLPVGHLDDTDLLDVKYEVCVKLSRKGGQRNMELNVPITVGNMNSASEKS